jgi:Domain of unknown function, B. Theta Gene description (DUF3876)
MKTKTIHFLVGAFMLLLSGLALSACSRSKANDMEKMRGDWISTGNHPAMTVFKEGNLYKAIVYRRGNHSGKFFPATYLLTQSGGQVFIEAGFCRIVSYDGKKDRLVLSPGGEFIRNNHRLPDRKNREAISQ